MEPMDIAKQFTAYYYSTFDADRKALAPLYKTVHQILTVDAQPSTPGSLIVLVTGNLLIDDNTMPLQFSQAFQLVQDGGSFYM
ncbi:hypothetical protein Clacol_006493 [Clathrus columnatus]|uniref:NTF2 domain-containing protein n=1 Tax=Clathrus columnatus TaxID=1419009 RepID=A0AAV5AF17_9AGAM|nr:hypothetical protein Clacol_006493 [Clathrus columnatus]